jgi:peptidoglycan/LPS O-acetylase OafA/YrhL
MLPKTEYLSNLTPLRGLAALLVAVFHFEMAIARFVPAAQTMFFEKCYLMVDLFFIMSGFIMVHVYGTDFRLSITKLALRKFLVARFARTYPLHFFSTALLILLVIAFSPVGTYPNLMEFPASIPTNIFLLQSYYIHRIYTWNIPSWSISAEWAAYACFPIFALFISKKKLLSVLILSILVVTSYISIMYLLPRKNPFNPAIPVPHNINSTYDYGFLRGIAGFTMGMLIYLVYQLPGCKRIFQKDWPAVLCFLILVMAMHLAVSDAFCVLLFAILVICFASNNKQVHFVCNNRVLQYLGNISYSIYLMQIFLQEPFSKGLRLPGTTGYGRGKQNIALGSGLLYCIVYLLLLVTIASITYYLIEQPCRKFINRKWQGGSDR